MSKTKIWKGNAMLNKPLDDATVQACLAAVNSVIRAGRLSGDGTDETAQRNGLILASTILSELLEAREVQILSPPVAVLRDIERERQRQVEVEGWTPEHDDKHANGELAQAAACYAEYAVLGEDMIIDSDEQDRPIPGGWPWSAEWWKPQNPRRDLVRAAALLVAEIERLDRMADGSPRGDE